MKFTQSHLLPILILTGLWFLPQVALANFIVEGVQGILWLVVVQVLGTFLGLAGVLFDYGINEFVINFGTQYTQNGIGFAVDATWVVIRDFVNMSFIFGLVYIGMRMILDSDTSSTRRWLVNLIIAALLINFSLFFTKFIVDVSNQFATAIATQGFQATGNNEIQVSVALMDKLGISNVFFTDLSGAAATQTPGFGYIFGTALLLIIATFVFAAGGILLIIRFAVLNLFFVFSPILFLGLILPPLAGSINKYWKTLLSKAFFAPLYLLFIYISFSILDAMGQSGAIQDGSNLGGAIAGTGREVLTDAQNTFPFFILASVLLIASLVVANKLGADGASKAVGLGKSLSQKAQRGTTRFAQNTGRFAVRQTGGRVANSATRLAGRGAANLEGRLNRRLATMAQTPGRSRALARLADRTAGATLRGTQNASVAGFESYSAQQTRREQQNARLNTINRQNAREDNVRDDQSTPQITNASTAAEITARQEARRRQQNEVRDMSPEEILERARNDREALMSPEFASLLTDAQITALRGSGVLSNTEMDQLEENRDNGTFDDITATLENANASTENLAAAMEELNRVMSTMSDDRRQGMMRFDDQGNLRGPLANNAVASRLSSANVDNMRQSGRASATQMTQITDSRDAGFTEIIRNGSLGNPGSPGGSDVNFQDRQRRALFRNAQDAGRLPVDVLAATTSQQYLTPRIVEEFLNNNPTDAQIALVRRNVQDYVASGRAPQGVDRTWSDWSRRTHQGRRFAL